MTAQDKRLAVAYDARILLHNAQPTGIPYYARELISAMAHHVNVLLMVDGHGLAMDAAVRIEVIPARRAWQQLHLSRAISRLRPDLFHGTHYTLPLFAPTCKVVTVHDLAFWRMPEVVEQDVRDYLRRWVPRSLVAASQVIVPSEHVRMEVISGFHVDPARVTAVPLGVGPPFTDAPAGAESSPKPWPYVLAVATLEPRKNLRRLIRAFALVLNEVPALPHRLLLVGRAGGDIGVLRDLVAAGGLDARVHMTGYVPRDELARLYRHAALFAYPSLYEGFGLPLLEAMASGCPVLTSNHSATAEVAAQAGILVDPWSIDALAGGLRQALVGQMDVAALRTRGLTCARDHTWDATARATLSVYQRALCEQPVRHRQLRAIWGTRSRA